MLLKADNATQANVDTSKNVERIWGGGASNGIKWNKLNH